jgi:uncharacterized membrane protein
MEERVVACLLALKGPNAQLIHSELESVDHQDARALLMILVMLILVLGTCNVCSVRSLVSASDVVSLSKSSVVIMSETDNHGTVTFIILDSILQVNFGCYS